MRWVAEKVQIFCRCYFGLQKKCRKSEDCRKQCCLVLGRGQRAASSGQGAGQAGQAGQGRAGQRAGQGRAGQGNRVNIAQSDVFRNMTSSRTGDGNDK